MIKVKLNNCCHYVISALRTLDSKGHVIILKIFLILEIIKAKSNIKLNELAKIKTKNSMILLDLIIF